MQVFGLVSPVKSQVGSTFDSEDSSVQVEMSRVTITVGHTDKDSYLLLEIEPGYQPTSQPTSNMTQLQPCAWLDETIISHDY